jgi:hypothetical protein
MNHAEHKPASALSKALDSYAEWLDCHFGSGSDLNDRRESGSSLLRSIAEIRRHSCPGASNLMTNLLLDHTKLSTLLFEQQLKLVRGQPTQPLAKSEECASLMKRQSATILAMRSACTLHRSFCVHTASTNDSAQQFAVRSATLPDAEHLQG